MVARNSENLRNGLVLIIGDSIRDPTPIINELKPIAFGFLCYTNLGLSKATELIKEKNIDMSCCFFEHIHGLADKREFFRKCSALLDILQNQCNTKLVALCVDKDNVEALALAAVAANRARSTLQILFENTVLVLDSSESVLLDLLATIVKEFNLSRYKESLIDLKKLNDTARNSKAKSYAGLLSKLALAYLEWDCRRYNEARDSLQNVLELLENTKDDFGHFYDRFKKKINLNIVFLNSLMSNWENLGALDAFFMGVRRYDAGDDLICILSLANSVEFCCRARLIANGIDPDNYHKINQSLEERIGTAAIKFFVEKRFFHVDNLCPTSDEPTKAHVTPGLSFKPGFVDVLHILEAMGDNFFKAITGVIEANENEAFLSVLQLNTLRNKIVHKMGAALDKELPKAIILTEYVLEEYLKLLVTDSPSSFPQLKEDPTESLLYQTNDYVAHLRLNFQDLARGIF
jgi:hypothetical protein